MRLIDADALKSKIREQPWKQETKVSLMLDWIYMLIDEASTIQTEALQQENEQLRKQVAVDAEVLRKVKDFLDRIYPADVFTGESGDEGALMIVELRKAIDKVLAGIREV